MSLQIRVDAEPDEAYRGCEALVAAMYPRSHAVWIVMVIYALAGLSAVMFAGEAAAVTITIAIGALLAVSWAIQLEARWRRRRALAADPHRDEAHFIELSDEGIRTYCDHVDSRITWSAITAVKETSAFYLFVRGASGGVAVPKRALTPAMDQTLRAGVRQWSPDRGSALAGDGEEPVGALAT
jgi:hypothetical protein